MKTLIRSAVLCVTLALAACGGESGGITPPPPPPPVTVDHVSVDPVAATINVGLTRQLQATAFEANGAAINGASFTYSSSAPTVASVSSIGTITGIVPGSATITTASGGKSAITAVTVQLAPVGNVTLTVSRTLLKESDTVRAIAVVRDEQNQVIDRDLVWSSSDSSVAVVTPTGIILGLRAGGPVTITASSGGKSGDVILAVIPANVAVVRVKPDTAIMLPGSTKQMTVTAIDEFGYPVLNRPVAWSAINTNAATVDSTGLVTAVAVGEASITATIGGVTGQALARVSTLALERFRIDVTNHLSYQVNILQNGVIVANVEGGGSASIERPLTPTLTLSWQMNPPANHGATLTESYPPILNPTGSIPLVIDNVMNDGRVYFNPVLRNLAEQKVLAHFLDQGSIPPCLCSVTTGNDVQEYGYWLYSPSATLKIYGEFDAAFAGPSLTIPVLLSAIEARTGVWRYTVLTAP